MTERIPHIYSYTSAGNTGRPVHPMCAAMAASPAAGESAPISPEVPQAHGLTTPATPSAAVGASEPGAGDADWKRRRQIREAAKEYSENTTADYQVQSDSNPANCHNPESEDTPPHNPVMGPVVGTATVKHQTSCPAATAPTVPPEVGKRYVCRNGVVTPLMKSDTLTGRNQPYYFCDIDGTTTYWGHDGRGYVGRQDDLIAEYREPEPVYSVDDEVARLQRELDAAVEYHANYTSKIDKALGQPRHDGCDLLTEHLREIERLKALSATTSQPVESPDDWVMITDQKHVIRKCDQLSDYGTQWYGPSDLTAALGKQYKNCGFKHLRCRRKDLPVVPAESPLHTNCGSVPKSVERGKLPPVDASNLPSIPQKVLDDRSDWREQAAAWSELFTWCCRNGFDCADHRYNGLTGLGTLAQWILDLKSAAKINHQNAPPADKLRMRTVTLRECKCYEYTLWGEHRYAGYEATGRTYVTEVPE